MKLSIQKIFLNLMLLSGVFILTGTVLPQMADTNSPIHQSEALRVFIDCDQCDFTYIRLNLQFVNYVRDPQLAQIHVLITVLKTASGGHEYKLHFFGKEVFTGQEHVLTYISQQSNTKDEDRRGITEVLKVGLLNYVIQTPQASQIHISYKEGEKETVIRNGKDPWNFWIFQVDLGGTVDSESSQSEFKLTGNLYANRTTELWKFINDVDLENEFENYEDDGETIKSDRIEIEMENDLVRSLSEKWSIGLFNRFRHTTYRNIAFGFRFSPAIEYNIFPWSDLDRRSFTVAYKAGVHSFKYINETIYDKKNEILFFEALDLELDFIQPWGEIRTGLEGSHFFHDISKYKIEFDCDIAVRLIKGLSLTLEIKAENIHDQLYLPKGDASLEEILLQKRQLATDYEFSSSIGIRFTFGSIYNNIINKRL